MKKLVVGMLATAFALSAQAREFPDLFVTPQSLSMGRATTAYVDDWNSLYSNPAGLAQLETWELRAPDLIQVTGSSSILDLVNTIKDFRGANLTTAQRLQSLRKFDGQAASFGVDAPAFVWARSRMAAGLNTASVNAAIRVRVPSALFLSMDARVTADSGLSLGYAQPFFKNHLRVGLAVRAINRIGFDKHLDSGDLDSLQDPNFLEKLGGAGWGIDADLGVQGNLDSLHIIGLEIKPMAGLVVNNLLATQFTNRIGADKFVGNIPRLERKANVGVAGSIENLGLFRPVLSLEYRNLFIPTGDVLENIAIGTDLQFKLRSWFKTALRGHFASGQLGGGLGFILGPGELELGTYAVNLGSGVGVGVSRRVYVKAGLAW